MDKEPKLKTKLEFRFNIEDLVVPEMDFIVEDPVEEIPKDIKILERKKRSDKKTKKLF